MTRTALDPWGISHPVLDLTDQGMKALSEYTFTQPTGVTIGKRWRRHLGGATWCAGKYVRQTPEDERRYPSETAIIWWLPALDGGKSGDWRERR